MLLFFLFFLKNADAVHIKISHPTLYHDCTSYNLTFLVVMVEVVTV